MLYTVISVILMFVSLMFIHELGHFLLAKRAGIFVREFSLGLGPKLFSFKKGETQYSLRILPFGAYVRMAGEDPEIVDIDPGQHIGIKLNAANEVTDIYVKEATGLQKIKVEHIDLEHDLVLKGIDEEDRGVTYPVTREAVLHYEKNKKAQIAPWDRQFGSKSILDRFAAILAGPLFNIILAVILFFTVTMMVGVPTNQTFIASVTEDSPAQSAGLQAGDIIVGIENTEVKGFDELLAAISSSPGKELNFVIYRGDDKKIIPVTPQKTDEGVKIGAEVHPVTRDATITEGVSNAFNNTADYTAAIFSGFKKIVTRDVSMDDIAGPVGIVGITKTFAERGIASLINWAALLSLYLGIFNLLPIPALDGSRLVFLTVEGVRGKPIDPQKESMVHLIGFALLMLLMIVVTVNDVSNIPKYFNK